MTTHGSLRPVRLERRGETTIVIHWSDGQTRQYTLRELRDQCPCATCREHRSQPPATPPLLPVLTPQEARPLGLVAMKPVGHYAYSIEFSDGHSTGIYTFDYLRQLGQEAP